MPLKNRVKDQLEELGLTVENYYVEGWPPVWGLALRRGNKDVLIVESHGCHTDNDRYRNKYIVRKERSKPGRHDKTILGDEIYVTKLQRIAIANWVRGEYRV